jgi:hypothetical protein
MGWTRACLVWCGVLAWPTCAGWVACAADALPCHKKATWAQTVLAARTAWSASAPPIAERAARLAAWWQRLEDDFPVECDWVLQDAGWEITPWLETAGDTAWERRLIARALADAPNTTPGAREFAVLCSESPGPGDARWLELYTAICAQRRATRLATVQAQAPRIIFTKRRTIRPSFFAYTEGQSDAQNERHFLPGAELCLLELDGPAGRVRTLLADPGGVIRDPAVSWDGERVIFAWKKSLEADDYHLYELDTRAGRLRQITSGLGFADYEPAWLPNGDLVFASTRCVQTVDCWWTEVSNLYTCDPDGRHLRRLTFDQVHSVYPQVLDDGRVIYTRWDYNDRGQVFPQALFQMHPDGTGQAEFYGDNSWFPTTLAHARGIPGTERVLAILCGHHTSQAGKLAVIDPARGRQENQGVRLVAPVRETPAERIDAYGQDGELWQYPWPLNEREFLVAYAPRGWAGPGERLEGDAHFGIYWMDVDGRRELLASDPCTPCQQPVPLASRTRPAVRASLVDYSKHTGAYYLQDIYAGAGLAGVPRGTVARLRVVALEFRPAGVGNNGSAGPGGAALISTPVAIGNGTWDVKVVLGETPVHADGSAFFNVPARTPVYFQALDANGYAVQTMRSWSTLQPGEVQGCVGCHEHKNSAPPTTGYPNTAALAAGPRDLEPFYGPPRGFSFPREIQPILDRHCIRCHDQRDRRPTVERLAGAITREEDPAWNVFPPAPDPVPPDPSPPAAVAVRPGEVPAAPAFSLRGDTTLDRLAKRHWSDAYLNLSLAQPADNDWDRGAYSGVFDGRVVNWIGSQSIPAPLPPYAAGAARSALLPLLARGHHGVRLSREEHDKLACWIDLLVPYCGDYLEANAWDEGERRKFQRYADKRRRMEQIECENIQAWQTRQHLP